MAAAGEECRGGASGDGAAADPLRRAAVRHGARAQHPVPHRPGPALSSPLSTMYNMQAFGTLGTYAVWV